MFGKGKYIILGLLCQYPCVAEPLLKFYDYLHSYLYEGLKW
jgi:hypothetical protein